MRQPITALGMAALSAVLAPFGCAAPNNVVYTAVNVPPRPFRRRSAESVEVFIGKPPVRPHIDVGLFEVYQGRTDNGERRSTEDMFRSVRIHGALRGCDALQIMNVELAGKAERRVVRAVCEVYTDDENRRAAVQQPPPPLPGEGHPCEVSSEGKGGAPWCPDPLSCEEGRCVSPYR